MQLSLAAVGQPGKCSEIMTKFAQVEVYRLLQTIENHHCYAAFY
jgi:hypothetical protein